jgi:hypothetical protein
VREEIPAGVTPGDGPDVVMVNRKQRIAVTTCNCHVPVTHWFDGRGEDCDPVDALYCVCGDEHHGWFMLDLVEFDYVTVH